MIRFLSLFSGIGAPEKALKNLGIEYELVGFSEIDKYAVKSYCAVHDVDESLNLGDITQIDETKLPKDIDLITYGFPCQDISLAGKQKGLFNDNGTKTRSGLFFDALRIIEHTKPKVAIAENVKALTSKKFKNQFELVLESLDRGGYNNYWQVLNASDYGIPQNRERVFIVSIRKDIDSGDFKFPEAIPLDKCIEDLLEEHIDEKFYLSDRLLMSYRENEHFNPNNKIHIIGKAGLSEQRSHIYGTDGVMGALTDTDYKQPKQIVQVGQIYPNSGNPQAGRIYDPNGISPSIDTCQGGNRMPKVIVDETHTDL